MTGDQAAFGADLRRERERRGVVLAAVAKSIKIKESLLTALERGEASHWPRGIYGRAFLREYAAAIGIPPETLVSEFLRLFPEPGTGAAERVDGTGASVLRLTLAPEPRWSGPMLVTQAASASIDALVVLATGTALATIFSTGILAATACVAVAYGAMSTILLGRSPALQLIHAAILRREDLKKARVRARPNSRDVLRIVSSPARVDHAAVDREVKRTERARRASR